MAKRRRRANRAATAATQRTATKRRRANNAARRNVNRPGRTANAADQSFYSAGRPKANRGNSPVTIRRGRRRIKGTMNPVAGGFVPGARRGGGGEKESY